jgi:hypothetical protein
MTDNSASNSLDAKFYFAEEGPRWLAEFVGGWILKDITRWYIGRLLGRECGGNDLP